MFWTKRDKEENRYYLLPGMGRSNRRQRMVYLRWALLVGVLVSGMVAGLLWLLSRL